ncbi:MAG: DUF4407 domain-containing protein [Pseudomonadota bacterium]|jgi:hypothetical protein
MTISSYLCHAAGEQPERVKRLHPASQQRVKAFGIAIHIPVLLWVVTGYLISSRVFHLEREVSLAVAGFCALLIYLIERLVLAAPKAWFVNLGRMLIGVVVAMLGASAVDLVVFDREVTLQLRAAGEQRIAEQYDAAIRAQRDEAGQRKADWLGAQQAAACEADGTCGSRVRSVGPVYQEQARQAARLRHDYEAALGRVEQLEGERARAIAQWQTSPRALEEAGLLSRLEALHDYTMDNRAALVAWVLFFLLVLCLELMVVLVKLVFGETVDDHLDQVREQVARHRAMSYLEGVTSPYAGVRNLIERSA